MATKSVLTNCPDPDCCGSIRCTLPAVSRIQILWLTDQRITISNDAPSVAELNSHICSACGRLIRVKWSRLDETTRARGVPIPCSNRDCRNRLRKCPGDHVQISDSPFSGGTAAPKGKTVCDECGKSTYFAAAPDVPDAIHLQLRFLPGAR
jgi:hypothetical protein